MTNPNRTGSREENVLPSSEVLQFNDGETALLFREPGTEIPLGASSFHKYARNFDASDMAILETKSGNMYALGRGVLINFDLKKAYELPAETINVVVGKPCDIPGIGSTSDVLNVMVRYKTVSPNGREVADMHVNRPSPFVSLSEQFDRIKS